MGGEGPSGLGNTGMLHFNLNRSFQSQMGAKLFNFLLNFIRVAPNTFQRFMCCISEIFFENFERFSLKCCELGKCSFFQQVRISPEIDRYHYQNANAAPTTIVRHRIKTDQF